MLVGCGFPVKEIISDDLDFNCENTFPPYKGLTKTSTVTGSECDGTHS